MIGPSEPLMRRPPPTWVRRAEPDLNVKSASPLDPADAELAVTALHLETVRPVDREVAVRRRPRGPARALR